MVTEVFSSYGIDPRKRKKCHLCRGELMTGPGEPEGLELLRAVVEGHRGALGLRDDGPKGLLSFSLAEPGACHIRG